MTFAPESTRKTVVNLTFRTISIQTALSFGTRVLFSHIFLWIAAGLLVGVFHHVLMSFLSLGGGPVRLGERLLEALLLSAWPFGFSAHVANQEHDGGNPGLSSLFTVPHLFSITFGLVCLALLALGGALAVVQVFAWWLPGAVAPLGATLTSPASVSAGWGLLPLLALGGMTFGLPYSFGPFVVVHEGEGFLSAFERSRFLTRDLRINLFFLQGFLFVVLCGAFSVFSAIPNRPTFTNHVLESVVITATSGLVSLVWNHAFRQALDLEKEPQGPTLTRPGRIHISDSSVSLSSLPPETP
ncbi:MAG: hypothetical protein KBG07_01980 [Elusimicrobia bacterium]|nr:hypothetical protein [Elusimicrobiota bacterium]